MQQMDGKQSIFCIVINLTHMIIVISTEGFKGITF